MDFLHVVIKISCLFICKNIAFTCVDPLLFFIIFIALLPFSMILKFNFGLNFNTMRLFYLNCKISFCFLPIKEKPLGSQNWSLKSKKYGCVLSRTWSTNIQDIVNPSTKVCLLKQLLDKGHKAPANVSNDFNIVFMNSKCKVYTCIKLQMIVISEASLEQIQDGAFCENS